MANLPRTAVEVFKLLPEGVYCQVIDNVIYISPAPTFQHQEIILTIGSLMHVYIKGKKSGKCVASPVDVFLDKNNVFLPDIIFLSNDNLSMIGKDGKVHGAPDLVVEVLSPGNASADKVKKKNVYEASGVKEYFIVDPATKEVTSFYLTEGKFRKTPPVKGRILSRLLKKTFKF